MNEDYIYGPYDLPELTVRGKLTPPKQQPLYRNPYRFNQKRWVASSTKQTDYDDLEKIYTAATAGLVPNVLTAARNFAQGDLAQGFVNLGWASEPRYAEDGTQIGIVAPGMLTGTGNAGAGAKPTIAIAQKDAKLIQQKDRLYESFVNSGRTDLALRMLDDKARSIGDVATDESGNILRLYRGDTGKYDIINQDTQNPVFLSTDKNYAEMYTSKRRFYDSNPNDDYSMQAVDLSDINPENLREYYGFGKTFNTAHHQKLNSSYAKSFFKANDFKVQEKQINVEALKKEQLQIDDKYLYFGAPKDKYEPYLKAYEKYRDEGVFPPETSEEIRKDVLRNFEIEDKIKQFKGSRYDRYKIGGPLEYITDGLVQFLRNSKKHPNGFFKKPVLDPKPKNPWYYDEWRINQIDKTKENLLSTHYDGVVGHDIPLDGEVENWRRSLGKEYAYRKSNNVKLRAITYDDNGKLIPLSQRLNLNNPNIKFMIPWGILGGALSLYGIENTEIK